MNHAIIRLEVFSQRQILLHIFIPLGLAQSHSKIKISIHIIITFSIRSFINSQIVNIENDASPALSNESWQFVMLTVPHCGYFLFLQSGHFHIVFYKQWEHFHTVDIDTEFGLVQDMHVLTVQFN